MTKRFHRIGETPHAHEQEGIELVRAALPNSDPYHGYALFELADSSSGRLLEVDVLVIGYGALYLLELKAHPGRIAGDATDWYWQPADDPTRHVWLDPPYRLANHKARILKSRLRQHLRDDTPYVQALVFLSAADLKLDLRADGELGVVTRKTLRDALVHHRFPGAPSGFQNRRFSAPQVDAIQRALDKLGVKPRRGKLRVGEFELGELVAEGPGYQDRLAVHTAQPKLRARARTYLVPQQTTVERRQHLRRAADRESALLYEVREHPQILSWLGYVPDAPLGPTVLLDAFEDGRPLPAFLRAESLTFDERLDLLSQVAHALAYGHRREVFHGGLCPDAVLVRRSARGLDVRLTSYQLGRSDEIDATSHLTALAALPSLVYQAPELLTDGARNARTDLFSLGALAHFLFTGRAPADDVVELHKKLERDQHLDLRLVDPEAPSPLVDAVALATAVAPSHRADEATTWIDLLWRDLTEPTLTESPDLDPLHARPKDLLTTDGDTFEVVSTLGQGATARVLHVIRESDTRELALKISLEPEHDDRLRAEAAALETLRHPRIVACHGTLTLGGRTCLLLGLAGEHTLRHDLDVQGTVSLDFASRYGDDLLQALEHLEEQSVLHRDIKPANLGVGSVSKTANHLILFDFSLADVPRGELAIGTSVYRDPFLPLRGAWDAAADRWSAAITLHEMLTAVRPGYEAALDRHAPLSLAAERFDATVRESLVAFFSRALHRDVEHRFGSAAEMRRAWLRVFEDEARAPSTPITNEPDEERDELSDDELRAIRPETPILALPLGFRARSALDRAGLVHARDLASLPENRLSAVRGVGTRVAREILRFRERWLAVLALEPTPAALFDPSFSGEPNAPLSDLDPRLLQAFDDAGLRTLGAIARTPREQVEALLARLAIDPTVLRAHLAAASASAETRARPTLAELVAQLFPRKGNARLVRALYGLDPPFEGRLDVSAKEVADHFGKPPATVYAAVTALHPVWHEHEATAELEDHAADLLAQNVGALPLERAASALRTAFSVDTTDTLAPVAALLRIVSEVQKDDPAGIRVARLGRGRLWLLASQDHAQVLRRLGQRADEIARRDVLASPGEAARQLAALVHGSADESPLRAATDAQLTELAAEASDHAACSTLLELYPHGLAPERALELTASHLHAAARRPDDPGLSEREVLDKLRARYPDAAPLPPRPALDALLARLDLEWEPTEERYRRKGELAPPSALSTRLASSSRSFVPRLIPRQDDDASVTVQDAERRLRIALERKSFCALAVSPAYALPASRALEAHLGLRARPLDLLLIEAMSQLRVEKKIAAEAIHAADREGPGGRHWPLLLKLVHEAEARVASELCATNEPLLLTRPGLLERYRTTRLLEALLARSQADDAGAIFVLVPCHDYGGLPQINDRLPIPGLLAPQVLRIPHELVQAHAA